MTTSALSTGEVLATFADINTGQMHTKNFADYFPEMVQELGQSIGEFIVSKY